MVYCFWCNDLWGGGNPGKRRATRVFWKFFFIVRPCMSVYFILRFWHWSIVSGVLGGTPAKRGAIIRWCVYEGGATGKLRGSWVVSFYFVFDIGLLFLVLRGDPIINMGLWVCPVKFCSLKFFRFRLCNLFRWCVNEVGATGKLRGSWVVSLYFVLTLVYCLWF